MNITSMSSNFTPPNLVKLCWVALTSAIPVRVKVLGCTNIIHIGFLGYNLNKLTNKTAPRVYYICTSHGFCQAQHYTHAVFFIENLLRRWAHAQGFGDLLGDDTDLSTEEGMRALSAALRALLPVRPMDLSDGQRTASLAFAAAFTKMAFLGLLMVRSHTACEFPVADTGCLHIGRLQLYWAAKLH